MRADPIAGTGVGAASGALADDRGAATALQVIAEFLGPGNVVELVST